MLYQVHLAFRLGKFFVSRLVFFANIPPKHDISVQKAVFAHLVIYAQFGLFDSV